MICPKCGFDQPDDIYCALCGVNIEKYVRKRRKRRYKVFLLIALIGIAGLSIAKYINSVYNVQTSKLARKYAYNKTKAEIKDVARPGAKPGRLLSGKKRDAPKITAYHPQTRSQKEPFAPERDEDKRLSPSHQQEAELGRDKQGKYTAREWFEKARALDDESKAEIECYQKAIELDPEFAPAYYRLGAIYYRQANYKLGDQEFAKFLKYASETDREAYDIYVYYSLSDVERLFEEKVKGPSLAEEAEKETPTEGEKVAGEPTGEEAEELTGEETGLETSEDVMTIVRFFPVDGHIIVPVVLNGFLKASVMVDTGSGITILSGEMARKLQLEGDPDNSITLKTMAVDIQAQLATLNSIQVGNLIEKNFRVAITQLPLGEERKFDGILGMDFMNKYKIHIDNDHDRILLCPGKKAR
ncbi:MAG: aspartyl protease family protein [Desulfobacterales bacterium]|nr:aspartyl protease family protein [Desulfobacterales bacterium]